MKPDLIKKTIHPIVVIATAAIMLAAGCAPDRPVSATGSQETKSTSQQSSSLSGDAMTVRQALREAAPALCTSGTDTQACRMIRLFSKGDLPSFPMGKRMTLGRAVLVGADQSQGMEDRVFVLWSYRDSEYPTLRLFDPNPENDREFKDASDAVASLQSGTPLPDNGFTRFLAKVSGTVNLHAVYPAEKALWFKGSETIKISKAHQVVEYFIRQNRGNYYVLQIIRGKDRTARYAIAELPGPALSIPPPK
ncbi:MAG: hypothetical protein V1793_08310 [Pseudomonadota bacterium]